MENSKEKKNYYDKKPVFGEQSGFKIREHFGKGMTAFLIVVACIAFYFAFLRFDFISGLLGEIFGLLRPIIYGIVIAYLLNPVEKWVEKYVAIGLGGFVKNEKKLEKASKSIAVFTSLIFGLAMVSVLFSMLIPELIKSIYDLIEKLPGQMQHFMDYVGEFREGNKEIYKILEVVLMEGSEALQNWAKTDLVKQTNQLMTGLTTGVISVVNGVLDIVIGIIVSVYALFGKEQFLGQGKKIIYAVMSPKRANLTLHILRKSNSIFSGFIIGKIIDSAIIGVLCFIGLSVLKMPYALLVSVFVGVTNVIPYFGPFIGAIPSAVLIMIVDPIKGLYFIIFIFLLQQLDGNVIGPTILGDSTGLSAFWVLFSILLFGGLFGVVGMIIGVPTFAVFYYLVKLFVTHKLESKNLPTETASYDEMSYVDDDGNYFTEVDEKIEEKKEEE